MKTKEYIKCIPNRYPYNELLLNGKLSAKTRSWKWKHTGLTLLYTSTSFDSEIVELHNLPHEFESMVIVGYGYLNPVRKNTIEELHQIEQEFGNGHFPATIGAAEFRYEFTGLKRFKTPIKFKPPKGAVSVFNIPIELVEKEIKKT